MRKFVVFLLVAVLLTSCGCSSAADEVVEIGESAQQAAPTVAEETAPEPEPTPIPIPEPVVYTGSGDDVIEIAPPDLYYVFRITGNESEDHFAVKSYDSAGEYGELLVNTSDPYAGITIDDSFDVKMLEITSSGDWTVEVVSLRDMNVVSGGETYNGTGDTVLLVNNPGMTATVLGNDSADYFAVWSYGEYRDLVVSTTEPYDGTVMLEDPFMFVVTAVGDWSITLN